MPLNPPTAPAVTYSGSTRAARVTVLEMGAIGELIWSTLSTPHWLQARIARGPFLEGVYEEEVDGPDGGIALLQARIDASGGGWFSLRYIDYRDDGWLLNGMEVHRIIHPDVGAGARANIDLHAFRLTRSDFDLSLTGTVTLETFTGLGVGEARMNLVIVDLRSGAELMFENVHLQSADTETANSFLLSGRTFDSALGYLEISTATPLTVSQSGVPIPYAGGPIAARGASDNAVWMEPLSVDYTFLSLLKGDQSTPERGLRLRWAELFPDQINLGNGLAPVAIGEPDRAAAPGIELVLDGRLSHHPGGVPMRFRWQLLFAPPGSNAALRAVDGFRVGLTPDRSGSYLIALEVHDGEQRSRDLMRIHVDPDETRSEGRYTVAMPPDCEVPLGQRIVVDGSLAAVAQPGTSSDDLFYKWLVVAPNGKSVTLDDENGPRPSFRASQRGHYQVFLQAAWGDGRQIIAVDRRLPPIVVWASTPATSSSAQDVAVADLTGDGRLDLVLSEASNLTSGGIPRIHVYAGDGGGRFAAPIATDGGLGRDIAVLDIGADGRHDLVATTLDGIELFAQDSGGVLQSIGALPGSPLGCFVHGPRYRSIAAGDLNGDGRDDIAVGHACGPGMDVFHQLPDGSFAAPIAVQPDPTGGFSMLEVADVTGDGIDDIVLVSQSHMSNDLSKLIVVRGRADSVVAADPPIWLQDNRLPWFHAGDLDADGRTDVAVTTSINLSTFMQNAAGELSLAQALPLTNVTSLRFVEVFDFDTDGRDDIVGYWSGFGVFRRQEDGSFAALESVPLLDGELAGTTSENTGQNARGDLNGDGFDEIVTAGAFHITAMFARDPLLCGGQCAPASAGSEAAALSVERAVYAERVKPSVSRIDLPSIRLRSRPPEE